MATSIVEYVLRMTGNLPSEAKEAAKHVASVEKASDKAKMAVEKLGQLGGGAVGQLTAAFADATDVLDGMGAALGGVGIAAGVGAVAIAGLAIGSKALADAAVAATDRLNEQGLAALIPEEARQSVQDYQDASADLRTEIDLLTVSLGSGVASAMSEVALATIGAIDAFGDLSDAASSVIDPLSEVGYALSWLSPARWELEALKWGMAQFAERGEEVAQSFDKIKASAEAAKSAISDTDMLLALGIVSPDEPAGKPKPTKASTGKAPEGYIGSQAHKDALEVARQGVAATNDLNVQIDELILDLAAGGDMTRQNTAAIERMPGEIGGAMDESLRRAGAESARQTMNLIGVVSQSLIGVLDLPAQLRDIIREIPQHLVGALSATLDLYSESIPDAIRAIVSEIPNMILTIGPQLVLSFATLGPRIALEITAAMVHGIASLFSPEFWIRAARSFAAAVGQEINDILNPFRSGGALGTNLSPAKGEQARFLGIKLPKFDIAMQRPVTLTQTGLAVVHKGEEIRAAGSATVAGGGGGLHVHVHGAVVGRNAAQELARMLQRELGTRGSGASLAPLGR